ncbi:WhiB family transcription factor [Streptomyces phage Xkcd426]|nr:WhiB family transcription factor [Streptomyces phage Xkcd426]
MGAQIVNFRPSGDQAWAQWAECAKPNQPYMFPSDQDHKGIQLAKDACAVCPVRAECLTEAFDRSEQFGVWGGLTTGERNTLRRKAVRRARRSGEELLSAEELTDMALTDELPEAAEMADVVALDTASAVLDGAA